MCWKGDLCGHRVSRVFFRMGLGGWTYVNMSMLLFMCATFVIIYLVGLHGHSYAHYVQSFPTHHWMMHCRISGSKILLSASCSLILSGQYVGYFVRSFRFLFLDLLSFLGLPSYPLSTFFLPSSRRISSWLGVAWARM